MSDRSPEEERRSSSEVEVKEESGSEYETDVKPKRKRAKGTAKVKSEPQAPRKSGKGSAWSAAELRALFDGVLAGKKGDELAACVPGRTANQCSTTWRNTVKPYLLQCLDAKGK